ncbi:hypothetical protein OFC37_31755, partial [Escherichia coli]|nr:hypothetical protein [Escherichia coli]
QISRVAREAAQRLGVDESLVLGITAVAFMTVRQVGLESFQRAAGKVTLSEQALRRTPDDVLRERARDDRQGLFSFLRTEDKRWTVTFD